MDEQTVSGTPEFWANVIAVMMEAPVAARVSMPLVAHIQRAIRGPQGTIDGKMPPDSVDIG